MSSEDAEIYILRDDQDAEDWVSPTPAGRAIADVVTAQTDLEDGDVQDIDEYVEPDDLRALFDGDHDGPIHFQVEGHEVAVDADGDIDVAD